MTCAKKALLVVALTTLLGLWGCTQSSPPNAGSVRLRELEARNARLEDDYRAAVTARDQTRKKVNILEEQRAQLAQQVEQLQCVAKERDEFRKQAVARTAERDLAQAQLVQFGRELQTLVQKIEQATQSNGSTPPVASAPAAPAATIEGGPNS
jgi:phosphoglycerate-specific signal transduction histidine kinase